MQSSEVVWSLNWSAALSESGKCWKTDPTVLSVSEGHYGDGEARKHRAGDFPEGPARRWDQRYTSGIPSCTCRGHLLFSYKKMLSPANCPRAQYCSVFLRRWHRLYDSGGMGVHGVPTGCALEPWHIRRPVGVQPMEVAGWSPSIFSAMHLSCQL